MRLSRRPATITHEIALFSIEQAASALGMSRRTLQGFLSEHPADYGGRPFYYPAGNRKMFTAEDVERIRAHMREVESGGAPGPFSHTKQRLPRLKGKLPKRRLPASAKTTGSKVYVVRCGNYVKIGTAQNFALRLKGLMGANPHDIKVIAVFDGDSQTEAALHQRFLAYHHRGEWFHCRDEVSKWVRQRCPL